ncbi:hypothetical protein [Nocardia rhizosphaerae]|uniref:Lsr2 protein n=1 Tax=Nocardia rhizosphaerae TaxID=1691571 RepID=A0ABV8LA60_9NOCA
MKRDTTRKPARGPWLARWDDRCRHCNEPIKAQSPVEWSRGRILHKACADAVHLTTRIADPAAARAAAHRKARKQGRRANQAEVRAAVAEATRNRDAILRGATFRAGSNPEAPTAPRRRAKAAR